ncbi:hypothetical protein KCU62_g8754, partial [Aureobasidium sp. EXF-3399]
MVPRQVTSTQYTNSSVTTRTSTDPSVSGAFCCQAYAPAAALNWWYTDTTIQAVQRTIVTEYLRYNNTIIPTATVTITNSSAAEVTGSYNAGAGPISIPGVPTALNAPPAFGQKYDQTIMLTETQEDFGYTTVAAPTPFIGFGYVFVFSGTVNNAGTCIGQGTGISSSTTTYDVYSEARQWFGGAAYEPLGQLSRYIQYTYFLLSTPYISVVSTTSGEWYKDFTSSKLEDAFITYLAKDEVALSAVPDIARCSPAWGAGAPGVHVQVSFLTISSAVTSTTNGLYVDKATTTSAVPANQPIPTGPVSTPATIVTTKGTLTPSAQQPGQPSAQLSDQAADQTSGQPTGQPTPQPEPSPSTAPPKVSEELGSPSQGQTDVPTASEISQNEPVPQPTLTLDETPQPIPQKTTVESPTAPVQHSDEVMSSGGQPTTNPVHTTSSEDQASKLPKPKPVDSQGGSQETTEVDPAQDAATQATVSGTSPVETSQNAAPVVIGEITASPATSGGYIVGSQTLIPGSAVEIAGTSYSLPPFGGVAVVNGESVQITTLASPTESAVPIVLGGLTGRPLSSGAYIVADQTISRGGSAIEISGTTYSLAPSGESIAVNGEASPVSVIQASAVQPATVVIGDVKAAPSSSGAYYVVAGQTLSPDGSAIEVSGVTYSLPSSGANVVINGATSNANAASTPAPVLLGSLTAVSFLGGGYIVASQILSPGGTAMDVSGTTYSLPASGDTVFINGAPTAIQSAALNGPTSVANAVDTPSSVVFGGVTATRFIAGGYILATQTLRPGGAAVEISRTTYSLATSGNTVFIDGNPTEYQSPAAAPLTIGSQTFNAVAASVTPLVVASQTLIPGGSAITVKGTTYSLPSSGTSNIVVDGQTTTLAHISGVPVLSGDSQQLSFTPLNSGIVVASQTLYPGGAITVNGETLSLGTSGSVVIAKSGESTTTEGLGDYIWQGIATSTSAPAAESVSGSRKMNGSTTTSGSSQFTEALSVSSTLFDTSLQPLIWTTEIMSSNATPTTTTAPPLIPTPTTTQPPLPPPQTFDILPPLHALLSRLEPSLNVYTPDTSAALPPNNAPHTPVTSASALPTSAPQQLDYKDAAVAAQFLKSRIRKALADLGGLADMHRGVEEQEEEIKSLEDKIQRQKDVLARLAVLADQDKS